MFCEHRKQRTGTGIFRWSVDEPFGSTPRKNQRREKFCESSRRNPAEQPLRAFFGYFLPPRAKSIIARKSKCTSQQILDTNHKKIYNKKLSVSQISVRNATCDIELASDSLTNKLDAVH